MNYVPVEGFFIYLPSAQQDEDNSGHLQRKHRIKKVAGYRLTYYE